VRAETVAQAKELVLALAAATCDRAQVSIDALSPDGDVGKFVVNGQVARAIHHFSGWHVPVNLAWFAGSLEPPSINGYPFHWYAFAIPQRNRPVRDHYLICDYLQVRDWVLDFDAPLGRDFRDQRTWRADIRVLTHDPTESSGYFRWGDEPVEAPPRPNRFVALDNAATIAERDVPGLRVGLFGPGGESAAHRELKLYVSRHPTDFGLSAAAVPRVEYGFRTGDRVDLLFENHSPERTVIEIEVDGEANVCTGIHQAVKYRSLAEVENGYPLHELRVRSLVIAYDVDYPGAVDLADRYSIELASVPAEKVLTDAVT
jgi:hypothetical protein